MKNNSPWHTYDVVKIVKEFHAKVQKIDHCT